MKDLIAQRHKEFEERFGGALDLTEVKANYFPHQIGTFGRVILSFHDQSVIAVLEKVREEVEKKLKEADGDGNTQWEHGYEDACYDTLSLLTSAIEELKS